MNQKFLILVLTLCSLELLFPHQTVATNPVIAAKKGVVAGVKKSSAIGLAAANGVGVGIKKAAWAIPAYTAKGLLLAPIKVPLVLGGKALLAAKLAVPMGIGAAIGAPVGAVIGAKAGAIKGALVGKALIGAKLGLAKKAALLAAGAKAKVAAVGVGLVAKKVSAIGAAATKAGSAIKAVSNKLHGLTTINLPTIPKFELPALPIAKASKGPTSIEYSLRVNNPHIGLKTKNASFFTDRRKREAMPEPQQGNAQQLLQLVRSQNAQQCLQRVICELSANPNSHGAEGVRFGRSLILLESQTDRRSAAQYREAANTGSKSTETKCKQIYPTCAFQSQEIIKLGNQMIGG